VTWHATFSPGEEVEYECDPHHNFMYGSFRVGSDPDHHRLLLLLLLLRRRRRRRRLASAAHRRDALRHRSRQRDDRRPPCRRLPGDAGRSGRLDDPGHRRDRVAQLPSERPWGRPLDGSLVERRGLVGGHAHGRYVHVPVRPAQRLHARLIRGLDRPTTSAASAAPASTSATACAARLTGAPDRHRPLELHDRRQDAGQPEGRHRQARAVHDRGPRPVERAQLPPPGIGPEQDDGRRVRRDAEVVGHARAGLLPLPVRSARDGDEGKPHCDRGRDAEDEGQRAPGAPVGPPRNRQRPSRSGPSLRASSCCDARESSRASPASSARARTSSISARAGPVATSSGWS
jgi:hypothetical protein